MQRTFTPRPGYVSPQQQEQARRERILGSLLREGKVVPNPADPSGESYLLTRSDRPLPRFF